MKYKCNRCLKTANMRSALKCEKCCPSNNSSNINTAMDNPHVISDFSSDYGSSSSSSSSDFSGGGGSFGGAGSSGDW